LGVLNVIDNEIIPMQERIENVADDADLEEVYDSERHLLCVACTALAMICWSLASSQHPNDFNELRSGFHWPMTNT
jgi:hypothetical protein